MVKDKCIMQINGLCLKSLKRVATVDVYANKK